MWPPPDWRTCRQPCSMAIGYGRPNVNPSSGPRINSWAGTQRVTTYAGEPFVPARYRIRPLAWVTSDVGLKEIKIWDDSKVIRRFLLNGAKEFKQTFEWAYDRQRVDVLEVVDVEGRRAMSAGFESWCDANFNFWCGDRQNGELWHGPLTMYSSISGSYFPGPRLPSMSVGPTWDGGPPPPACASYYIHPGVKIKPDRYEGLLGRGDRRWKATCGRPALMSPWPISRLTAIIIMRRASWPMPTVLWVPLRRPSA